MKAMFAVIFSVLLSTPVIANDDWELVTHSASTTVESGGLISKTYVYVMPNRIKHVGNKVVEGWYMFDYAKPEVVAGKTYYSVVGKASLKCGAREESLIYAIAYSEGMASGPVVYTDDLTREYKYAYKPIVPNTIFEGVADYMCSKFGY